MYGKKGRIGLVVPEGNSCIEPEFQRMLPEGVISLSTRIHLKDVTPESLSEMKGYAVQAAKQVALSRIGVVAFACTSGSFVGGKGYDGELVKMMEDATGVPATTTTSAVMRALDLLDITRVALVTPYPDQVTELEVKFFHDHGVEVTRWKGGGISDVADIQESEPSVSYNRALEVDDDRAQAVFMSCTGSRTIENLQELEAKLGKPVISSNQATLADCLRVLNVKQVKPGFGSLFEYVFAGTDKEDQSEMISA